MPNTMDTMPRKRKTKESPASLKAKSLKKEHRENKPGRSTKRKADKHKPKYKKQGSKRGS